jgi:mono/diheme cytochrome c family protein
MRTLFLLAGLSLTAVAAAVTPATSSSPSADRGRQTFVRVGCSACHGTQGQGSSAGMRLAPDPLPLAALVQFVRNATGAMPPYGEKILSEAALADIQAYLASVRPPPSPDSIAALKDLKDTK